MVGFEQGLLDGARLPSGLGQGQLSPALAGMPQQQDSCAWACTGAQSPTPPPKSSATVRMARRIIRTEKPPEDPQ